LNSITDIPALYPFRDLSAPTVGVKLLEHSAKRAGVPHLVFAVGGTGAQAELPGLFLPSLRSLLERGKLRLTLVAGIREDVRTRFEEELDEANLSDRLGRDRRPPARSPERREPRRGCLGRVPEAPVPRHPAHRSAPFVASLRGL
jgi:hypothetical protein